jgi:uncharacterized Zn finger protein
MTESQHDQHDHHEQLQQQEPAQATKPLQQTPPPPSSGTRWSRADHRTLRPRRVRNGYKLQSKLPLVLRSSFAQRFMKLFEGHIPQDRLAAGAEYARTGQIAVLALKPGVIEATVQGTASRPYHTSIAVPALADELWPDIIRAMASEAVYVAKLLANEIPPGLDELFIAQGAQFFPLSLASEAWQCSCGGEQPCKHAAAVGFIVAEQLDSAPLSIFQLLGMPSERLLDELRHARAQLGRSLEMTGSGTGTGSGAALGDPMIPESQLDPLPLEQCLDDFWRIGPRLGEIESSPPPHHAEHALLRRLGPSPLNGKFPLVGLLASIYDTIAIMARQKRDQETNNSAP